MLFMTILFFARGSSDGLWDEVLYGTLRRWQAAGASLAAFLAARLIAFSLVATVVAVLGLSGGHLLLQVDVANWPAAILWVVAGAALWHVMMIILQTAAGNQRNGEILTSFVIFPSMMLGGSMFPFAMMPASLAAIGKATPLGWMVDRFDLILSGRATAQSLALWTAAIIGISAVLFLYSFWSLRRKNFNQ
jgi:ABC-type multidrug transport system permease subunit